MPGWHNPTKKYVESGELQVIGVLQEQHPDRAKLFHQWQGLDFPLLADPLNRLDVSAVPITLFVEPDGRIVARNPKHKDLAAFLESEPKSAESGEKAEAEDEISKHIRSGDWNAAVREGEKKLASEKGGGRSHFELGCLYRMRYDSEARQEDDFLKAVTHWNFALKENPNQYIWRRRIQQYGPRLDKPYSFYDWVNTARKDITARGETPVPLKAEPGGAEFAYPAKDSGKAQIATNPDPGGEITRDLDAVKAGVVAVAATKGGKVWRVHVSLTPSEAGNWEWNNEADPVSLWVSGGNEWKLDRSLTDVPNPTDAAHSKETRSLEFEARWEGSDSPTPLAAYALYHLCDTDSGQCVLRRRDMELDASAW